MLGKSIGPESNTNQQVNSNAVTASFELPEPATGWSLFLARHNFSNSLSFFEVFLDNNDSPTCTGSAETLDDLFLSKAYSSNINPCSPNAGLSTKLQNGPRYCFAAENGVGSTVFKFFCVGS